MAGWRLALVLVVVAATVFAGLAAYHYTSSRRAAGATPPPPALPSAATVSPVASPKAAGTAPPKAGRTVEVVDLAGRRVRLRVPVERVVLIDGGHTGYIVAVDAVAGVDGLKRIVGLDLSEWKRVRPQLYNLYVSVHPWLAGVADIGASYKELNIEEIIRLKPDVVIAPPHAFERLEESGALSKLEHAGIPVVMVDFHSETWNRTRRSIELLGVIFGKPDRARKLIEWYKAHMRLVEERVSGLFKPKVYIEAGYRKWRTWSEKYMWGRLVELAGGNNIAAGLFPRSGSVNPEYLVETGAEVVIVTGGWWASGGPRLGPNATVELAQRTLAEWVNRTTLLSTPALRHYSVCAVYHALARTVWDVVGLEYLAKAIHPAAMRDVNVTRDLQEFFEKFLSIPFRGVWFTCLEPPRRTVTVVDVLGRHVRVRVPVKRVAILYGLEDWVAVTGEDGLSRVVVLNRFRYEKWRPDWWAMWVEHFPWIARLPDTGQPGRSFNVEVVIRAKPDVVITTPWMYKHMVESGDAKRLEEAGVPIVVIDFVPKTTSLREHLEAVRRSIMVLGELLGYEDRSLKLAKFYEEQVLYVVERVKGVPEKPKVIVFATWSTWRAYGEKGMYHVWITFAGGDDIGAKVIKGSSGDVSPEFVLEENPDVIVFACNNNFPSGQKVVIGYTVNSTKPAKEALRELVRRPGWDRLNAVRNGRVYLIHHGLSHGHIFQYVCLQYMAKWLHPDTFEKLDPARSLAEFFEKFMPFPVKGVWGVGIGDP